MPGQEFGLYSLAVSCFGGKETHGQISMQEKHYRVVQKMKDPQRVGSRQLIFSKPVGHEISGPRCGNNKQEQIAGWHQQHNTANSKTTSDAYYWLLPSFVKSTNFPGALPFDSFDLFLFNGNICKVPTLRMLINIDVDS